MRIPVLPPVMAAIAACALTWPVAAASAPDQGLKVVIVRHGEKPKHGNNLSCQGENRALQLPAVLLKKFNTPDYTYVPALKLGKSSSHARMFQTVTPFAIKSNLTVNTKFGESDVSNVAKDVLKQTGTVLMVWEHSQIPLLARQLGVSKPPDWQGEDFDSIWIITYATGQALLSFDKQGITPSSECNF